MASYVRVLHASPEAPAIHVCDENNNIIVRDLDYCGFSEYMPVTAGTYYIRCIPPGVEEPLINTSCSITDNSICTVTATGGVENTEVISVCESPVSISPDQFCLRFANLSHNSREVDVYLSNGTTLASNVSYGDTTRYVVLSPGTYTIRVVGSGTNNVLLIVPNQTFSSGRHYTAYMVGSSEGDSSLKMLTPLDGISYLSVE
ncbi:MAG: DUF4397 domain-containing protein [Bacillota bacterium]